MSESSHPDQFMILDLDQTMVYTHSHIEKFDMLNIFQKKHRMKLRKKLYTMELYDVSVEDGVGDKIVLSGIHRPFSKEFIDYSHSRFKAIGVWSAGRMKYVHKITDDLFPFEDRRPCVVYTYDDCDVGEDDYLKKPLKKMFDDPRLRHLGMNEKNTFILDDREDTFSLNHGNGIQIPEFECDMTAEEIDKHDDVCLLKVMFWLDHPEVKWCEDVRDLDKDYIFDKSLKEYTKQARKSKGKGKPSPSRRKNKSPKRKTTSPKRKKKTSPKRRSKGPKESSPSRRLRSKRKEM
jgi:hypothetical protein